MNCLLALGFFTAANTERPAAHAVLAQAFMHQAWDAADERGASEVERRWPGTFPALRLFADDSKVDLIVLSGNRPETLALGPGYLASSALPGENGNTVITGRRDTFFRFLADLEVGDSLAIETLAGQKHLYRVIGIDVVDARRSSLVLDTPQSILSLVTAYPFDPEERADSLRYVVTARMLF